MHAQVEDVSIANMGMHAACVLHQFPHLLSYMAHTNTKKTLPIQKPYTKTLR